MSDEEVEYEVENITQARVEKEKGRKKILIWKYRVRWKGYGSDDDTWEPKESFVGSEHIIEQFWQRANSGGRDYRDMSLFEVGEEFVLTGPPPYTLSMLGRKPKQQPVKSTVAAAPVSPEPNSSTTLESGISTNEKRRRSPSITEIRDSDDEVRPTKRLRKDKDIVKPSPKSPRPLPGHDKSVRNTSQQQFSLPTKSRISPRKAVRAPSHDEIIPASDDELARPHDTESFKVNSRKVAMSTNILETSLDNSHSHVGTADSGEHLQESVMDQDVSPDRVGFRSAVDSASQTAKLPAHRAKGANPKVKIAEIDYATPEGALSIKARLSGRGTTSSAKGSSSHRVKIGNGSKPGPGRSSVGFMKKNTSSLLTFEKGTLKTVKGRYNKEVDEKNQASESYGQTESSPTGSLWGGDDEMTKDDDLDFLSTAPPTANELLHLAGAELAGKSLPDFEDDPSAQVAPINPDSFPTVLGQPARVTEADSAVTEPQQDSSRPAHWESLQRAKDNLFPSNATSTLQASMVLWKQPTMFGPLGFGLSSQPNEVVASDIAQTSPFFININSSVSIPVMLTDVALSHPGSPSLEFIVAKRGPPGVFYNQKAALVLLDTLRTGGPSAKIGLHPSASSDHKSQFEQFRSRLSAGELYAGMAGDEFLAFCSSDDSLLSQRLNICPQLLGQPGDIFVERVVIENYSAYAEAALAESTRINKPFKPPTLLVPIDRVQPQRKRKRVSYKGQQGADGDSEDEDEDSRKKKKKKDDRDGTYHNEEDLLAAIKTYPVYKPKPFEQVVRRFSMPAMTNKDGDTVSLIPTNISLGIRPKAKMIPRPLHDPMEDHAIVLYDPTIDDRETDVERKEREKEEAKEKAAQEARAKTAGMYNPHKSLRALLGEGKDQKEKIDKVPVVIDPKLSKVLRPHQVEGVKFLYKCASGMLVENQYGCIMADEMGLGKTLQCITLLWTLLKQSPRAGKPTIEKCIIACPSSLVKNWANEFVKWLGKDALNPLAVDGKGGKSELLEKVALWNDLTEYFSLLSFANPNFLGSKNDFRKNFENLIIRGRDAEATDEVKAKSEEKLKELGGLVTKFIIRRTNDLLSKYLPVKYEHVVFCGLSEFQLSLYRLFISSPEIKALLRGTDSQPLKAINILKKLCNHPELLNLPEDLRGSEHLIPEGFAGAGASSKERGRSQTVRCDWSGKFVVLERFLHHIKTHTTDKIVLISNYTQTLDLFEKLCRSKKYGFFRLDGTMTITKRQKLVDQFNDPEGKEFIFLLSSKAGGCGINLIGANRLVLFDPDWNPAADQQALARVWRDGQKKECFVYRFISTGTIEEKIFQRQANKQALSSAVVDEKEDAERHFSLDSLRKLFNFNEKTLCETHETFKCKRCKDGKQVVKSPALLYGDASTWNHFTNAELQNNHDDLLRAEVGLPEVSFVFQYISH
ncbi:hypothetical protein C0995_003765 [Termitomyces sp. Mi166|nr:hypothetical protein C0995_003765 [Termitomyces sp. Mi166\